MGIIPARGGSKGVPRKNIHNLAGKPLIAWTIEEAKKSKYIDRLILSSDDTEIIQVARQWGCDAPFVRPSELAADNTPGIVPVLHAIDVLPEFAIVVLLQPTSPLRSVVDIDGCIETCMRKNAYSCVSVTETEKSPYWMYRLDEADRMIPMIDFTGKSSNRQEMPKTYVLNGAIYVAQAKWLQEKKTFVTAQTIAYPMPQVRSVDVDTELDLIYVQTIITEGILWKSSEDLGI